MTTQRQNPAYRPTSTAPDIEESPGGKSAGASARLTRRIFALADTHLPGSIGKTMDRYGSEWHQHPRQIASNARKTVEPDDVFLIPGDLSWATKRKQAESDLAYLAGLPGIKVAIKGNHDFWWESDKPIHYPGLLSPPVILDGGALGIAGSRGWNAPVPGTPTAASDAKFIERERLRLSKSLAAIQDCAVKIAMLHFPPHPFMDLLTAANVAVIAYGHIHRNSLPADEVLAMDGELLDGIPCFCVACDRIGFTPKRIL